MEHAILSASVGYFYAFASIVAYIVMAITTRTMQIVESNLMIMASNIVTVVLSLLAIIEETVRTRNDPF